MLRSAGIVALFVLAACGQTTAATGPSPSPVIAQGTWTQSLTLTGDLQGQISSILPDDGGQQSICSGGKARNGDTWSESFFASVDTTGDQWQVSISIDIFRGPGTYTNKDLQVVLQSPDNSRAWLNQDPDKVTFTIDRSQQSGTIDAQLTNASTGKNAAEHITGRWNCRG